eukprot:gb/GEZN01001996.1/.p1 GENE.gb/GEZN01001996.1/~~gb/GEZN01001996.1/.p1  ORF type:complete len:834 (+),score=124.29 gb/GEZN01001996.1/:196-2502(+)
MFNCLVAGICIMCFSLLRPRILWFYYPRKQDDQPPKKETGVKDSSPPGNTQGQVEETEVDSLFGWIPTSFMASDEEVMRAGGEDAVVYMRYHRLALKLFTVMMIVACPVLMPIYGHGGPKTHLDQYSLTNVDNGSPLLWLPLLAIYLFSFLCYKLLLAECAHFVQLRRQYMLSHLSSPSERTLLVQGLTPPHSSDQGFSIFWRQIYKEEVSDTTLVHNIKPLCARMNERDRAIKQLTIAKAKLGVGLPVPSGCTDDPSLMDSIEYYTDLVQDLTEEIERLLEEMGPRGQGMPEIAAGFVTFRSAREATIARQIPPSRDSFAAHWDIQQAPEPRDVLWGNLGMSSTMLSFRRAFVAIAVFMLTFFYIVPVSFISGFTSLATLTEALPFLKPLLYSSPTLKGFLEGVLPTLALSIFLSILPIVFQKLAIYKGISCRSQVTMQVLRYYHFFNVVNVFLVATLSGSVLDDLEGVVNEPTHIPRLLGSALPAQGFFFLNYLMLQALFMWPWKLLNPVALCLARCTRSRATVREELDQMDRARANQAWPLVFDYGVEYAVNLLMFTISFSFAVICPLILVFSVVYHVICLCGGAYMVTHLERPKFQTGGRFWPMVFDRLISALVVAQLTVCGLLGVKQAKVPSALCGVLLVFTFLCWRYEHTYYFPRSEILSMQTLSTKSVSADTQVAEQTSISSDSKRVATPAGRGSEGAYLHPALLAARDPVKQRQIEALLTSHEQSDKDGTIENIRPTIVVSLPLISGHSQTSDSFLDSSR